MEIILEQTDQTNAIIKVNLKQEDYHGKVSEKLKDYSKKTSLKGFRPGKVPSSLIQKMYGKSILVDEINNMLSNSVKKYIQDNKLNIVGDPLPDTTSAPPIDWDNQKEFEFAYNIGIVPDFQYDLNGKKFERLTIEVSDKDVEETIENLRNQYGKTTNPDTTIEGDTIYGEVKDLNGDFSHTSLVSINKIKAEKRPIFVGLKKDDVINFEISETFEDAATLAHALGIELEEAENKSGPFELKVVNINRPEPADLDQEFFDKLFGKDAVNDLNGFKAKLKDTIQENYQKEADKLFARTIEEYLVDSTSMELPDEFLKRWLLVTNQGKLTEEQIDKDFKYYLKELKWSLIRNKIGQDFGIKVENEEVVDKAKEMIRQQFGGMSFGDEMEETFNKIAENYLQQEKGKNYIKLFEEVFFEKIMFILHDKISVSPKTVTTTEFKEIAGF